MSLVTPDIGLIIWQLIIFLIVLFILRLFVWRPILGALKTREFKIEDSLRSAEHAKEEMKQIKADNEYLLREARIERDAMLKEARKEAKNIIDRTKAEIFDINSKMIQEANYTIEARKKEALTKIKTLVSSLSLEIAEKLLREKLNDDESQKALVEKFINNRKIN